jgi:hypothetical protein
VVSDPRAWLRDLPAELGVQAGLLDRLLTAVEADPSWEWLEVGCSVGAGRADQLSDLDLGLGCGRDAFDVAAVSRLLAGLGEVVELAEQPWGNGCHRWWVQYVDGGQIDLVVMPAQARAGLPPGSVALLDRAGRLQARFVPSIYTAAPEDPRRWLLDGWEALANAAKYLQRGSLFEATEALHTARSRIYQLWAAGEGVPYPKFGLTSLLDVAGATLPPGIETTYACPDADRLRVAALRAANLLDTAGRHAQSGLTTPLGGYVLNRLRGG